MGGGADDGEGGAGRWWLRAALVAGTPAVVLACQPLGAALGLPPRAAGPQVAAWLLVVLVRLLPVQRLLGGGSTTNRPLLRVVVGCAAFAVALAASGAPSLFPAAAAVVVGVHVHWSGARAVLPGAAVAVAGTVAVQVASAAGWVDQPLPLALSHQVAGCALALALGTVVNAALLTAQREAGAAALAAERDARDAALVHAVQHDHLTGLLSRAGVHAVLARAAAAARPGAGTAVVFADLDGFKAVNDEHGHAFGDRVLVAVGQRLRGALRDRDVLARPGGDEFVAVLVDLASAADADRAAARLTDALREPLLVDGVLVRVGMSTGVAHADGAADVEDLLHDADAGMYAAKRARRRAAEVAAAGARPPR